MVRSFNQRQVILGCVNILMSGIACVAAFVFFRTVIWKVTGAFHIGLEGSLQLLLACSLVGVIFVAGIFQWRRGEGHESYADSSLNVQLEWVSGGAFMMERYAQRVTAPAHVLSQLFLAGPLQLMKGITRFRSLLPVDSQFEARLSEMLEEIRHRKTWHSIDGYVGREKELSALIRMDAVEYSPRKGTVRTTQASS
jgi:hypothetical protein